MMLLKKWAGTFFVLMGAMVLFAEPLEQPTMALYSTTNAAQGEVAWSTRPGIRYLLQESADLQSWSTIDGFPSEASALAQQHVIELAGVSKAFFRVQVLDEQPPEIKSNPDDGDFGVGRFSTVGIDLSDATAVDSNSISLILGTNGTFTLASPELTWSTNSLVLDLGGDTALGGYGTTQEVTLVVADTLGNATNYVWSFELEQEIDEATNLFVFGSPDAQRAGQRLSGLSATVAARFNGPVRMSSSSEGWEIDTVTSNEVMISYSTNAPSFEVGQMLANLAPAHESEIFYRRIDSISDNTLSNLLTLGTTEVLIGEIMENGSFSLGDGDAVFLEFDTNGTLVAAIDLNETISLPVIGDDFSGTSLWSDGALDLSLAEGCFTLTPQLKVSLETKGLTVERFEARVSGDLEISCVPQLTVTGSYNDSISKELWRKDHWYWTAVGYIPVGVQWIGSVTAIAKIDVDATAQMSVGFRQSDTTWVSGTYVRGRMPASVMDRKGLSLATIEKVPFTYSLDGSGNAVVSLVPQIDCRLYGAAGIYLNTNPRLEVSGSASMINQELTEADFLIGAYANINVGLSLIGDLAADLPPLSFNYFTKEWNEHVVAEIPPLTIAVQPISKNATYGDNVTFSVQADGGTGSYAYQWYQDSNPIPGKTGDTLRLYQVGDGHEGEFFVKIWSGSESVYSATRTLNVVAGGGTGTTSGMVRIPGGTNSGTDDLGAYSLTVSSFYMDRTEVTKAQWDRVYNWAVSHGYSFDNAGSGKASNHPVHTVNWYDCVKWCNARSEMEGKTPCYNLLTWECDFDADGYRLPTSTEWEYAARGDLRSKRFPWGDTINHNYANYRANGSEFSYDTSSYTSFTYHPSYDVGGYPYTSPAGSFFWNGYGLYDMAGNVWEWCNTASGLYRRAQGGSGYSGAYNVHCGIGYWYPPDAARQYRGFRAVRR